MLEREYSNQTCSIARSLEVVGERWSLLIIRDVLLGKTTFTQLVDSLGITRTVLTHRLTLLVEHGVLERQAYLERPVRHEYRLTTKGRGLLPVIAHLMWWGDEYYPADGGPPRLLEHHACGGAVQAGYTCTTCHAPLGPADIDARPGPGFRTQEPGA
jgi:DNA-binding HxlR family transcriptional regulator